MAVRTVDPESVAARLSLRLRALVGVVHADLHLHRFTQATAPVAAHGAGVEVVEADGDADVAAGRAEPIGDVVAAPALALDPGLGPGVAGHVAVGGAAEIAGDVAGGDVE